MSVTQTAVKEVIPEVGGNFTLDANVIRGAYEVLDVLHPTEYNFRVAEGSADFAGLQLWHCTVDTSGTNRCGIDRWYNFVILS